MEELDREELKETKTLAVLKLPIYKWFSREHLRQNRKRRLQKKQAKKNRKHWRIVNDISLYV